MRALPRRVHCTRAGLGSSHSFLYAERSQSPSPSLLLLSPASAYSDHSRLVRTKMPSSPISAGGGGRELAGGGSGRGVEMVRTKLQRQHTRLDANRQTHRCTLARAHTHTHVSSTSSLTILPGKFDGQIKPLVPITMPRSYTSSLSPPPSLLCRSTHLHQIHSLAHT